jgi:hypothetical protein
VAIEHMLKTSHDSETNQQIPLQAIYQPLYDHHAASIVPCTAYNAQQEW